METQPPLGPADDGLFAKMRAEDKQANLRLIFGISRWAIEKIEAIPTLAKQAHQKDPLTLLTEANAVINRELRAYSGSSIEEFRGRVAEALDRRFREIFGHGV